MSATMQKTFTDMFDRRIDIGDVVLYTVGAGQSVAGLGLAKVVKLGKSTVTVQFLNDDFTVKQVKDGYWQGTGEFYHWGTEKQEFITTGFRDIDPTLVANPRPDRFYIVKKI